MCLQTFLKSLLLLYSLSPVIAKLGTQDACVNMHKTVEQIFKLLDFKIFGEFFKFHIRTWSL